MQKGCRLCILVYDAMKAKKKPGDFTIDSRGILLKSEWSPTKSTESKTARFDDSAPTRNTRLIESHVGSSYQAENRLGPLLTISWGDFTSHLRFNVQQDPQPKTHGAYITNWDSYSSTRNFVPYVTHSDRVKHTSSLASAGDAPGVFEQINSWLDECMQKHGYTCTWVGSRVLETGYSSPTRLIQVGELGDTPRLVRSADLGRDEGGYGPSYTALSHAWGDPPAPTLQTTTATVDQNMSVGIQLEDLSQTFQHAIEITRRLKVGYLWIDTLCIVQDDKLDKERELPLMDSIYSMAICTIVAADSIDGRGGCLYPRGPDPDIHVRPYTMTHTQPRSNLTVVIQPYFADWGQSITSGPVFKRGWCFQERQLAKRVLYFTETQVLWECRTAIASEAWPEMVSHGYTNNYAAKRPFHTEWSMVGDTYMLADSLERVEPWFKDWLRVVEAYSEKSLTDPHDRLKAVGGLAAHFETKIRRPNPNLNIYLAGIWYGDFARGLAWSPNLVSRHPPKSGSSWPPPFMHASTYQPIRQAQDEILSEWLPSWSWISIPGPVRYYYSEGLIDKPGPGGITLDPRLPNGALPMAFSPVEILSSGILLAPPRQYRFGEVSCGIIELQSLVVEVKVSEKNLIRGSNTKASMPKCYSMFKKAIGPLPVLRRKGLFANGAIVFDVDPYELQEIKVYCLRLGTARSLFDTSEGGVEFGLALIELTNTVDPDVCERLSPIPWLRRVGLFEIDVWNKPFQKNAVRKEICIV